MKMFDLTGKVAIVTGGTGHLGKSICKSLYQAGADVVIADKVAGKETFLIEGDSFQKDFELFYIDISDEDSIRGCISAIFSRKKRIDILVNNAAFSAPGDLTGMTVENWIKGMDGTVNSIFRCTKEIIPYFYNGGNIINIASMYGMVSPDPSIYDTSGFNNPPNYGAGKAAVIQFTRYCAVHLAPKNIRVNCISPGAFPNEKVQENKEFIENLKKKNPMNRIGLPEDLGGPVVFLVSNASSYITGHNLVVDGGWTIW